MRNTISPKTNNSTALVPYEQNLQKEVEFQTLKALLQKAYPNCNYPENFQDLLLGLHEKDVEKPHVVIFHVNCVCEKTKTLEPMEIPPSNITKYQGNPIYHRVNFKEIYECLLNQNCKASVSDFGNLTTLDFEKKTYSEYQDYFKKLGGHYLFHFTKNLKLFTNNPRQENLVQGVVFTPKRLRALHEYALSENACKYLLRPKVYNEYVNMLRKLWFKQKKDTEEENKQKNENITQDIDVD